MEKPQSSINPWARADEEKLNPDTLALFPKTLQEKYAAVLEELASAGTALNESYAAVHIAQSRFAAAQAMRSEVVREASHG